ncbi:unnamed protein product [Hyaloperonospora brassicae]|uniref:Uncharacterized protein n=1 Tax=Hyaloperonospora brassicae TaxID=162125 RepID=A0AAV0UD37_HYABA|nr:unnamed protein product [Hyaloperonospora brassicae]
MYRLVLFCVQFGVTMYDGNKGQSFETEVFGGIPNSAGVCSLKICTVNQERYSDGMTWLHATFPQNLEEVLVVACIVQTLLMIAAFAK